MRVRTYVAAVTIALAFASGGCSSEPEPIAIEGGTITVQNRTGREWRNVRITVNDHFTGGAPRLAADGRLNAPLSQFQTGHGQKFNLARQVVTTIEVTATDAAGQTVRLAWPANARTE
jgi:hypothetical protein